MVHRVNMSEKYRIKKEQLSVRKIKRGVPTSNHFAAHTELSYAAHHIDLPLPPTEQLDTPLTLLHPIRSYSTSHIIAMSQPT
jgi:hypothetical protein